MLIAPASCFHDDVPFYPKSNKYVESCAITSLFKSNDISENVISAKSSILPAE